MPAAGLRVAVSRFFAEPERVSFLGSSSGFSGSSIVRVEARGTSWCLRAWPAGFERDRLSFVHRALRRGRASGFSGVPLLATTGEGNTVLELDGCLFDAQEWMPGEPLSGEPAWDGPTPNSVRSLGRGRLSSLTKAVAHFHRSTADLEPEHDGEKEPLSVRSVDASRELAAREVLLADVGGKAKGRARHVALRWLELLPVATEMAEGILREHPVGTVDVSVLCHGDLWASHVHFAGSNFAGLLDFESLCFCSPALDLAQLALHFDGWSASETVVDSYREVRPLGAESLAVLPAAALVDLIREGCWSLGRLYAGEGDLAPPERQTHEHNLDALLVSLEIIVAEASHPR